MTIKRRLFLSNILMIAVPIMATAVVGLLCIGFIWISFINGFGIEVHDQEDFDIVCALVSEKVENAIKKDSDFSALEPLLDSNGMTVRICSGTNVLYSYGKQNTDEALYTAANSLGNGATVTQNGCTLRRSEVKTDKTAYTLYLSGGYHHIRSYANLKIVAVFATILITFTVFLSVLLTNRFLTRFVLRRIEEPLDLLANGVHELRDGNLDYRITYLHRDEFQPVCEDFNEMAGRLKESVQRLQQQEQSRKELIAGISHDIRSPLTSIQAYVEGLIDGVAKTPESKNRYLQTIKAKAEDLEHIVAQLFLYSKMELGEYQDNSKELQLDHVIADAISPLQAEYSQKGLDISVDLEPVKLHADPIQIERIVTNIIENSLKYKGKDQGYLKITLQRTATGSRLSFADDGPGVADDELPRLFEVFYRSDPARQNPNQGSGLGLAIVSSIVEHIGGKVRALHSEFGGLEICIEFLSEGKGNGEDIDHRG